MVTVAGESEHLQRVHKETIRPISIQQRQKTSPQRAITWAPTLWSLHSIPTEQDSEENQKDSAHETEICKYPVRLFHFCNNPICV